jgi:ribosome-associated toxin RatA of RatAB toxin-antitoxin module
MRILTRSALVARRPAEVFALVNDIASYPQFVPGCSGAEILSTTPTEVVARLRVHRGPLSTELTTRNQLRPPDEIGLDLVDGPLRALQGTWRFSAVGANGCRIELRLEFEFSNALKAALLEPLIEGVATSMVQAFVTRAQSTPEAGVHGA